MSSAMYPLEKLLYEAANTAGYNGLDELETELYSIADAVGELEYRLESLEK